MIYCHYEASSSELQCPKPRTRSPSSARADARRRPSSVFPSKSSPGIQVSVPTSGGKIRPRLLLRGGAALCGTRRRPARPRKRHGPRPVAGTARDSHLPDLQPLPVRRRSHVAARAPRAHPVALRAACRTCGFPGWYGKPLETFLTPRPPLHFLRVVSGGLPGVLGRGKRRGGVGCLTPRPPLHFLRVVSGGLPGVLGRGKRSGEMPHPRPLSIFFAT
jgi:hypothetical protein